MIELWVVSVVKLLSHR